MSIFLLNAYLFHFNHKCMSYGVFDDNYRIYWLYKAGYLKTNGCNR